MPSCSRSSALWLAGRSVGEHCLPHGNARAFAELFMKDERDSTRDPRRQAADGGVGAGPISWRSWMYQDREERIRARAYEIWEREGRQEGSHEAHWQQAERELQEDSGEGQQEDDSAATPTAGASGLASGLQPSGSAPSAGPGAGAGSVGTGGGSTADSPSGAPRKKS